MKPAIVVVVLTTIVVCICWNRYKEKSKNIDVRYPLSVQDMKEILKERKVVNPIDFPSMNLQNPKTVLLNRSNNNTGEAICQYPLVLLSNFRSTGHMDFRGLDCASVALGQQVRGRTELGVGAQDIVSVRGVLDQFSEYINAQTEEWKKRHSYLLNGLLNGKRTAPSFHINKRLGDNLNMHGDVYNFDNGRDRYVIKIGPKAVDDPYYEKSLSSPYEYFEYFVDVDRTDGFEETRYESNYSTSDTLPEFTYSVFENGKVKELYYDEKPENGCPEEYKLKSEDKIKVSPSAKERGIYKFVCENQGKTKQMSSRRIYAHPVEIQNIIAKEGKAPKIVGAGLFGGHRVTVMEKIQDAQTLNQIMISLVVAYKRQMDENKRLTAKESDALREEIERYATMFKEHQEAANGNRKEWITQQIKDGRIMKNFNELMKSKGFCHHDIHSKNIVYGNLNDKKDWYLIDFDGSYHLQDKKKFKDLDDYANDKTKHCNDEIIKIL